MPFTSFDAYLKSIQKNLQKGSERSHYPSLKDLLDEPKKGIDAVIEEKGNKAGIPDFTVKRLGQWRIDRTGSGILAFITNHGYLDNPTFRGMRQSLDKTFDEIYFNVFDIQQGVAIAIMIKFPKEKST